MCIVKLNKLAVVIAISLMFVENHAVAGGLWAQDFGDPAMGRANSGAAAGVNDASTVLHNSAYMTEFEQSQAMVAGGLIYTNLDFNLENVDTTTLRGSQAGTENGGNPGGLLGGASAFYVAPIDEQWSWGISFSGASGGLAEHDSDWVGRFDLIDLSLIIVGLSPQVAYKVNDWLSVGGGVTLLYADAELKLALPKVLPTAEKEQILKVTDNDFIISYSLSAMAKLNESTRVGIHYQPEITVEFDDLEIEQPSDFDQQNAIAADLVYGQAIRIGITHHVNDKIEVLATLGWDDWSALDEVPVKFRDQELSVDESWDDTYHFALGISYSLDDQWLISSGISHDTNPVDKDKRYAQLAIDSQTRIAVGLQYDYGKPFSIGGQFLYLDAGDAEIERTGLYYQGKFDKNEAFMLMVNANWIF